MTHFSPGVPALPLSPLLVVKFHLILTPDFMITFSLFYVTFLSIYTDFDEKLDFTIKNWCF